MQLKDEVYASKQYCYLTTSWYERFGAIVSPLAFAHNYQVMTDVPLFSFHLGLLLHPTCLAKICLEVLAVVSGSGWWECFWFLGFLWMEMTERHRAIPSISFIYISGLFFKILTHLQIEEWWYWLWNDPIILFIFWQSHLNLVSFTYQIAPIWMVKKNNGSSLIASGRKLSWKAVFGKDERGHILQAKCFNQWYSKMDTEAKVWSLK